MGAIEAVSGSRSGSASYTAAQSRVLQAALSLFAEHGVSGTSIRMIADAIGVTKAAIYFQFKTKDEIVLAAAGLALAKLELALESAEAEDSPTRARELLLGQVIEICIEQRRITRTLQHDPVMLRLLMEHEEFQQLFVRMQSLLIGEDPDPQTRVHAAMLSGAIAGGVTHLLVADLDDDTIRSQLLGLAQHFLPSFDRQDGHGTASLRADRPGGTTWKQNRES